MQTNQVLPVDPAKVSTKTLYTGAKIPAVGLGTFGSDNYDAATIANAVEQAIRLGYRHIDCASVYGNEKEIGAAIAKVIKEGVVTREELWITSKVWNDSHHRVAESARQSLKDLQLDYLDLYLVHWPFPNFHAPKVGVDSRDPNAKPYIHEDYMQTWRAMEKLVDEGLVRHIGTSNMTVPKLKLLLRDCRIQPACNEMEMHPHFQQPELFDLVIQNGIAAIGYCPIGSPNRPERDKTANDTVPIEDPVIVAIAQAHGIHPAVVCIKWAVQNGQIPIPFSVKPEKFMSNLRAAIEDPLTEHEMQAIKAIDRNNRFIKGQVFTWEGATWEDLWD
ncbi:MAG: Aldo/keto reductase [Candidatus Ordinivivax streblomastigis]|uniref:Aldo/keto reductase n=1 Tax=Candidatus Ordinivivax streblomastigis TaxID=2540710 RepID=A0A5M8NZ96_9BACT|nr:MAG: Aldo/keto reductase [Candidatus Ordinivivax streblomastigis]